MLNKNNIQEIILCVGFKSNDIYQLYGNTYKDIKLKYSIEQEPLGTAGAIKNAHHMINNNSILVLNGDTFCQINIKQLYKYHQNKKSDITIVANNYTHDNNSAGIYVNNKNKIISYTEKNNTNAMYLSAGIYIINNKLINQIPSNIKISLEYEIIPKWILNNNCYIYPIKNKFIDIGTPSGYRTFIYDNKQNSI
jgi:NDP-sugar pyrophosphorylase family protein